MGINNSKLSSVHSDKNFAYHTMQKNSWYQNKYISKKKSSEINSFDLISIQKSVVSIFNKYLIYLLLYNYYLLFILFI